MGKYVCDIGGITTASYLDVEGKSFSTFFFFQNRLILGRDFYDIFLPNVLST